MNSTKNRVLLVLLFVGMHLCFSQNIPQGFNRYQATLAAISKTIANKNYDSGIKQANKVVAEAISNKDTVTLRDAYRLLSKAYHFKKDTKHRDQYERLIQKLAVAYGYHVDEGLAYIAKNPNEFTFIYDEFQLLEDRKGKLTFKEISSPLFQNKYKNNFTVASGEELYSFRELGYYVGDPPKTLFNQDAVYWAKIKVIGSKTEKSNYLFHIGLFWGASWDKVDLYVPSQNKAIEHFQFGLTLSPNEKDFKYNQNLFEIALEKNEVKTLYLRLAGARKDNNVGWRPSFVSLNLADTRNFLELDGYYHIPDSITHVHGFSQPRRLSHILNALNFIEDPNQKYSLKDVTHNWDKLDPKFPYQLIAQKPSAYYWAKLNVVNKAKNTIRHSFMLPELWDDVSVYVPDANKKYKKLITGSNIEDDKKTVPGLYNIFRVNAHYNDTLTLYIKFKSNKIFLNSSTCLTKFEMAHLDESQLWRDHNKQYLPYYLMIGILLIQMLYYFINFLINKERTHLYLMFLFLGFFLAILNSSNIFSQFQSNQAIGFLGASISILGLFKYTVTILNIKQLSNWVHKFNRVIFFIVLIALLSLVGYLSYHYFFDPMAASDDTPILFNINLGIISFVMITLFIQAIYAAIKRVKYANFFLLFYILFVITFLIPFLPANWGITPDQVIALSYFFIALSTLGLMLITAYRLKQLRKDQAEKEKAQASERAKHQFLANMSHEIRTPMNAIKGMTDILIRRNPKDDQKEYLNTIKQSSDSLLVIINDILDISKIEAGKITLEHEPFSVNDLVNNVNTIMQFKAEEKGLQLKKDIPNERLNVIGDDTRLRQILINLIGNAIKFTEKGIVTTSVRAEQISDKINLHFTVSDTGIGIDKDRMEIIFKSFEQAYSDTSRKFGGTGLGLSISQKLVELHKGKIWVESEPEKGSQFHFILVYDLAETATQEFQSENTDNNIAEKLKGISILLVEDNQFNAVVAQEELEDAIEGVTVEVAENGLIAVEKLKSFHFDIILMDVQMPTMNGYEATKAIRALDNEKAKTPIIAMTANVFKEEVDLCQQAGMNDFIEKPFDTNELIQKIYNLINKTHD